MKAEEASPANDSPNGPSDDRPGEAPTLDYARAEKSPRRFALSALLLLGPLVLVVILVGVELTWARSAYKMTGRLPAFVGYACIAELLLLLAALANAPLMHWHLRASRAYSQAGPLSKVAIALPAALAYVAVVIGALFFVLMIHME